MHSDGSARRIASQNISAVAGVFRRTPLDRTTSPLYFRGSRSLRRRGREMSLSRLAIRRRQLALRLILVTGAVMGSSLVPSSLPVRTLLQVDFTRPAKTSTVLAIFATPPTADELNRLGFERERAAKRANGSPLTAVSSGEFLFIIERSLLPDELTAARVAALEALRREWRPGVAIPLVGSSGEDYARGVAAQLSPSSRTDLYNTSITAARSRSSAPPRW